MATRWTHARHPVHAVTLVLSGALGCSGSLAIQGPQDERDAGRAVVDRDTGAPASTPDAGSVLPDLGPTVGADAGRPDPSEDAGPLPPTDFVEVDGLVVFEAEHAHEQIRDEWTRWYAFTDGAPDPDVMCRTHVSCGGGNAPDCNEYGDCDPDAIDPADASGGTYLEALPDRRRTDHEPGTGGQIGVVNDPDRAPTLRYRVRFATPGRYYVWVRARGQGPAANGLHVGIDGTWPRNELTDPSSMRLQFRNGWRWTQTRRGGRNHTGVPATEEVSLRDANVWIEVPDAGVHVIMLGMREDGLEIDKVLLTIDPDLEPQDFGPPETTP
ncbi:MAG: hypothetical protein ACFCGT_21095 [Sandaracinaceae bacterium]